MEKSVIKKYNFDCSYIYHDMSNILYRNDYLLKSDLNEKKEVFLSSLLEYFKGRLDEFDMPYDKNVSLEEIFEFICSIQDDEKKYKSLSHVLHYLLSNISDFQGYEVVWYINKELGYNDRIFDFNADGKLDKLSTSEVYDIEHTFNALYHIIKGDVLEIPSKLERKSTWKN